MRNSSAGNKNLSLIGATFFFLGVMLALALAVFAIWADYEALFYGFDLYGDQRLADVDCPVLVTPNQPGLVTAKYHNPSGKEISLTVRASFSSSGPLQQTQRILPLAAGESQEVSWPVTRENVDLRYFIFAQVSQMPTATLPYRQSICGMTMIDVPVLSGDQLFALWFLAVIGSLVGGLFLWYANNQPVEWQKLSFYNAMRFSGVTALLTLFLGIQGWWVFGIVLLIFSLVGLIGTVTWKLLP